ncbi:MAG TPA: hypothetical protein VIL82_08790 [Solirubrobacteraceae bacterium]
MTALDTYLNDHLAGASFGSDLARQLVGRVQGAPMDRIAQEIEEDRQTLTELMDRLGTTKNPVKQAITWLAEKASRVKLTGIGPGTSEELATFLALETLCLGVEGKKELWIALKEIQAEHPPLGTFGLDALIQRATAQREALETDRLAAARRALAGGPS